MRFRSNKGEILGALAVALICIATLLIVEGLTAVARWSAPDVSVTYRIYHLVKKILPIKKTVMVNAGKDEGPLFTRLLERDEVDAILPKLKFAGVVLGNSPYRELTENPATNVNAMEDGCQIQKPNLRKTMTYLRSNLFNPLCPITLYYDSDRNLAPDIIKLIETYGQRLISYTTNAQGERTTLPVVTSDRKVIVAGDSVANGSVIDDSETISSQLQALDPTRQYINLGICGAGPADIICALNKAARRYKGQIEELIYVYCANDFGTGPYGKPEEVVSWLKNFVNAQRIAKVTVVFAPYIYNVVPQYTRGSEYAAQAGGYAAQAREGAALAALVGEAGFRYIDISDVALAEAARAKTQFAALSVFSDYVHLSPYGIARLVQRLMADTAPHQASTAPQSLTSQ